LILQELLTTDSASLERKNMGAAKRLATTIIPYYTAAALYHVLETFLKLSFVYKI
jgi:hypothetical protein